MCVPMLGMVAGLAGWMVSAMGAMSQSKAEADAARRAAITAKINAQQDRYVGAQKQEDIGGATDKKVGGAVAGFGKNGVDAGYGSAASLIFETEFAGQSDKDRTYIAAESSAVGNENKARDLEAQAASKRKAGPLSFLAALGSGIGGTFKSGASSGLMLNETA